MRKMESNESYWIGIFVCVDVRLLPSTFSTEISFVWAMAQRSSAQNSSERCVCFEFMYVDKYEMSMIELLLNLNACTQ